MFCVAWFMWLMVFPIPSRHMVGCAFSSLVAGWSPMSSFGHWVVSRSDTCHGWSVYKANVRCFQVITIHRIKEEIIVENR